jgi:hypothetical protein
VIGLETVRVNLAAHSLISTFENEPSFAGFFLGWLDLADHCAAFCKQPFGCGIVQRPDVIIDSTTAEFGLTPWECDLEFGEWHYAMVPV